MNRPNRHFSRNRRQQSQPRRSRPSQVATTDVNKYINKPTGQVQKVEYQATHRFENLDIHHHLKRNIVAKGYSTPTPIQDQAIPPILEGRDVIGIANTGTGKTAAFLIPMLNKVMNHPMQRVLILLPTRELAMQVFDDFKDFARAANIYAAVCIGGVGMGGQMAQIKRNPAFVIATPGRLKDLTQQKVIDLSQFHNVVLDEVDRMVDIGFIRDIKYFISLLPSQRQSLFFSATISPEVTQIMNAFLHDPITVSVKTHETAKTIEQDVIHVRNKDEKMDKLVELLGKEGFKKVIVFGRTKWGVEKLGKILNQKGISAASIHGNKNQNQRQRALNEFKQNKLQVLVATDVAARGLDIPDVSHVINFDEPATYDDYVHRIGRTGRAEKTGYALTFVENAHNR